MDTESLTRLIFGLLGGLGIFLLGMKHMSEGMQAVAGNSLRRMIAAVTNNRLMATGVGVVATCTVQSSTVTTVMVVGLVNSGVMTLAQAIGVIMGANVGTTITGWILVLKIGVYGLPLLGAAALVYLFARGDRWRYWAMAIMGVGMIFFGLELMKERCAVIREMPEFAAWFARFHAETYWGVLACALVGCVMTIAVQSSSATLAITISLAFEGVISYPTAAALVLGENLGTTVTAYLATLGATTNARRAAYFHVIFNLAGVLWITAVFFQYIRLIDWVVGGDIGAPTMRGTQEVYPNTTAAIAATHSIFNIANTLLFLPFLPWFARLLEWLLPGKPYKEKPHLTDLDIRMLETPMLAIEQSRREILKMGDGCSKMLGWLATLLGQSEPDPALVQKLQNRERVLDSVQDEVAEFVVNLLTSSAPHAIAEEARQQLRLADEFESISDYVASILKFHTKLLRDGERLTERELGRLMGLHRQVAQYVDAVNAAYRQQNRNVLTEIDELHKQTRRTIKQARRQHLEDLSSEQISPLVIVAYLATLNSYARVRDHAQNIAEVIAGEK